MMAEFKNFSVSTDERGVVTATLDVPDRPVNIFDDSVLTELHSIVELVRSGSSDMRALVFRSGKPSGFLAGADVHRFQDLSNTDDVERIVEQGQELFNSIESLNVPTFAVINGACLGGGLEFAMACRYRLAVDHPSTKLGLPEVKLGLIPAWGGTQRLPRLIGLSEALNMMLQGKTASARQAYKLGLVNQLITAFDANEEIDAFVMQRLQNVPSREPRRSWKQWVLNGNRIGRNLVIATARKRVSRQARHYPAVKNIIRAAEAGMNSPAISSAGLKKEREAFAKLLFGSTASNLIDIFLWQEQARKSSTWTSVDVQTPVERIAVIGAGTMGAGIAQVAALKGFEVILQDVQEEFVLRGEKTVHNLNEKAVSKGAISRDDANAAEDRLSTRVGWDDSHDVDLLIEAVIEQMDVKKSVFSKADELLPMHAVLASNTSALPIDEMAAATNRPEKVAGLHFFNPVHKMPLVEVVSTPSSDDHTIAVLVGVAKRLGKVPIVVRQSPGFLVNRILFPYLDEAVRLVVEGFDVKDIDRAAKSFGMPVGPLELLDVVGLDVGEHVAQTLVPLASEPSPTPTALKTMVNAGQSGKKAGKGFYVWKGDKREQVAELPGIVVSPTSVEAIGEWSINGETFGPIQQRLMLAMINEAWKCLHEQIVAEPWMIDLGMVLGTGFAPFRGGPMKCIETWGPDNVRARLQVLSKNLGPRFTPASPNEHPSAAPETEPPASIPSHQPL